MQNKTLFPTLGTSLLDEHIIMMYKILYTHYYTHNQNPDPSINNNCRMTWIVFSQTACIVVYIILHKRGF